MFDSVEDIDIEIGRVCEQMVSLSRAVLPLQKPACKGKKKFIIDPRIKSLSKASRSARVCWAQNDRPSSGPLFDEMVRAKKTLRRQLAIARARLDRKLIQIKKETHSSVLFTL